MFEKIMSKAMLGCGATAVCATCVYVVYALVSMIRDDRQQSRNMDQMYKDIRDRWKKRDEAIWKGSNANG